MRLQRKGANVTTLSTDTRELLYSYETLVGVAIVSEHGGRDYYFQRDGKAGSRTTAKHITQWLNGHNAEQVSEARLISLAGV